MGSNSEVLRSAAVDGAVVTHLVIADLAGHDRDNALDKDLQDAAQVAGHKKDADAPDAEGAVIHRIDEAVDALGDVDFGTWSDSSLSGHLDELSLVLCRVDAELSRLADAVRSRGFDIAEIDLPLAS